MNGLICPIWAGVPGLASDDAFPEFPKLVTPESLEHLEDVKGLGGGG